jgi:DNA-binding transcriptional LysR family regulator
LQTTVAGLMASKLPDFEGLAMFAKVVEERSFAAAARTMGVSVATVSRAVSRLEERLGARLLNRTSRQLALTEFGQAVAEAAIAVYQGAERAEAAARELTAKPRGLVRLAVPMSFGLRWVAPVLPDFLQEYPEISVDLHLSDAVVDLIGEGFDAALRIAVLPDSSLVARRLCPVSRYIVASPGYVERHGEPRHPRDLIGRPCLRYAYRARSDVWRFINDRGEEETVTPVGPLRVTNVDALIPTILADLAIAELPDFIASEYLRDGRMVQLLKEWPFPTGAVYFMTPTLRARPPKVEVLGDFFARKLTEPGRGWKD